MTRYIDDPMFVDERAVAYAKRYCKPSEREDLIEGMRGSCANCLDHPCTDSFAPMTIDGGHVVCRNQMPFPSLKEFRETLERDCLNCRWGANLGGDGLCDGGGFKTAYLADMTVVCANFEPLEPHQRPFESLVAIPYETQ